MSIVKRGLLAVVLILLFLAWLGSQVEDDETGEQTTTSDG